MWEAGDSRPSAETQMAWIAFTTVVLENRHWPAAVPVPALSDELSTVRFSGGLKLLPLPPITNTVVVSPPLLPPAPGAPSQRIFETVLRMPCGFPHVSGWLKPLAAAATGSITMPAYASED